ncbi:PTS glucose transporter subunit IIA [Alteromonas sp. 5E99-2]|uniref:PTS glucose transporter subunit IIA n=1 Tax=Alteromonas sp. 5E99-2 TaxID=2817683 RepID=UPI001A99A967|nr:PTS glucose transporter subunit IIA [Alteromonas sp. 5E99-2]MBO1254883.1 PTS glucose transporter subunit IIA [Alteromonas sp. 5E99-2]
MIQSEDQIGSNVPSEYKHELLVSATMSGNVTSLTSLHNIPLQTGIWGSGVAIKTRGTACISPFDGTVEKLDIASQRWILKSKEGLRLCIQIGPTSSSLLGERLSIHKRVNDKIQQGDIICNIDPVFLQKKLGHCYCVMTILNKKGVNAIVCEKENTKVTVENTVIRIYL